MSNEKHDRELGMNRVIPRRDFLNGMSLAIGGSLTGPQEFWAAMLAAADKPYAPEKEPGYYPPSRTGNAREPRRVLGGSSCDAGREGMEPANPRYGELSR